MVSESNPGAGSQGSLVCDMLSMEHLLVAKNPEVLFLCLPFPGLFRKLKSPSHSFRLAWDHHEQPSLLCAADTRVSTCIRL